MSYQSIYHLLADGVLVLHGTLVAFVVLGLLLTIAGGYRRWGWIRNAWFRVTHLAVVVVVVAQTWMGVRCPLTSLEMSFRRRTGVSHYETGFIEHWLQRALFYDLPPWVFVAAYSVFGLLVVLTWRRFPPRSIGSKAQR